MLMTLGRQLRTWFRTKIAMAPFPTPPGAVPTVAAPEPPPLPHEVLIELDDDVWEEDPDEDRRTWEAAFCLAPEPRERH